MRQVVGFDGNWYLANYKDIAEHASKNFNFDPEQHFQEFGRFENRLPCAPEGFYNRIFSYGSYGSNNLGDDAIFEGVKTYYPECTEIYLFKSRGGNAVEYNVPLEKNFFQKGDYLILGGGGLLYSQENVSYMIRLAKNVLDAGGVVDVLRMGCEGAHANFSDEIMELFSLARFVSVRSTISVKLIKDLIGMNVCYQKDFAFRLAQRKKIPSNQSEFLKIGLSLASIDDGSLLSLAQQIKRYLIDNLGAKVKFYFLPHSQSFFDPGNNDNVVFHRLWSMLRDVHRFYDDPFELLPFRESVSLLLDDYASLNVFIGARYHSLVFSSFFDIPTIVLGASLLKNQSFLVDHARENLYPCTDINDLYSLLVEVTSSR